MCNLDTMKPVEIKVTNKQSQSGQHQTNKYVRAFNKFPPTGLLKKQHKTGSCLETKRRIYNIQRTSKQCIRLPCFHHFSRPKDLKELPNHLDSRADRVESSNIITSKNTLQNDSNSHGSRFNTQSRYQVHVQTPTTTI